MPQILSTWFLHIPFGSKLQVRYAQRLRWDYHVLSPVFTLLDPSLEGTNQTSTDVYELGFSYLSISIFILLRISELDMGASAISDYNQAIKNKPKKVDPSDKSKQQMIFFFFFISYIVFLNFKRSLPEKFHFTYILSTSHGYLGKWHVFF